MIVRSAAVLEFYGHQLKKLASLWTITRKDGTIMRYTNHDAPIVYGGNIFYAAHGFDGSARQNQNALRDSTVEFTGVISSPAITSEDLRGGKYKDAKITETVVNWQYPYLGAFLMPTWWIDGVTFDGEIWTAQLSGPERFLKQKLGEVFDRTCDATLYDTECTVNPASFTIANVVVAGMEDGDKKLVIFATTGSLGAFADDYFAYGEVQFTSGLNNGTRQNVKMYRGLDRRIELQGPMLYEIQVGDQFSILAGCDKRFATCKGTFSNGPNFKGWPFMITADRALESLQSV